MREDQSVSEMATQVLARQAGARAGRTGEPFYKALESVLETDAGRLLGDLRKEDHRDESASEWHENLPRERAVERKRLQTEERGRLREVERSQARQAAWESFMRRERRELELRKEGQLAVLLGEALADESPVALRKLAKEDRRQAEEGLVALTSNGGVSYKRVDELVEGDMEARVAADRLRTAWLKSRRDEWLGYGADSYGEGSV